jgi:hypothetical protein
MSQPLLFPGVLILPQRCSPKRYSRPEISRCHAYLLFKKIWEEPFKQDFTGSICEALTGFSRNMMVTLNNTADMAMTIEIQNTGDPRARREILAGVEHVLSDAAGEWPVSIVGSRADDNWEMKVEGPRGFERSYTLVGKAGEHQPEAIRNVLIKLLPASTR